MILQCSNCNARYLVPDKSIGAGGRTVRCARCAHSWFENPPLASVNVADDNIPDLDTMLGNINEIPIPIKPLAVGANLPVRREEKAGFGLKLLVFFVFLVVVALGVFLEMPKPLVSQFLGIVGFQPSEGLVLADIKMNKRDDAAEIIGNIVNNTDVPHQVPTLRVMLVDEGGNPLQFWEYKGNGKMLAAKEVLPFSTGELAIKFTTAKRFMVDLGTPFELALRRKP
jgi:predicted Zn finger-like uncharacterized protein